MRRRIMHILASKGGNMGVLERHVFTLCAAQLEHYEVHLLADKPYAASCPKGVVFHALDLNFSIWNPMLYWHIAQCIKAVQPHIVHAQSDQAASVLRWLTWCFKSSVFIVSLHDVAQLSLAYKHMDGVCLVNTYLTLDFPADKTCHLLYHTQPTQRLTPQEKDAIRQQLLQTQQLPLIMAMGDFVPAQGFEVLVQAFVGVEARLVLVGNGGEHQRLDLLIKDLGLSDKVLVLESRRDSLLWLQAADLCVIPSVQGAQLPVLMAALHAGCPVIATDIAGVSAWLAPGLLVPPNQVAALHDLLCATLPRLSMLRTNYLPIFLRAQQELTLEGMVQRTQHFYEYLWEHRR